MAAAGKSKEADGAARCRRHPSHRHSAGVCPSCLRDRLSRLSAAAASANNAASSTSSASSPRARSSGEESVASSARLAPPCREARRTRPRLALLMRQEESEMEVAVRSGGDQGGQEEEAPASGEIKKAKRSNFWSRLQQGASWYRKADGCSLAHSKAVGEKSAAAPKRAPLF